MLVAGMLVAPARFLTAFRYVYTLYHELGHAIPAYLSGGGASAIVINADASGVVGRAVDIGRLCWYLAMSSPRSSDARI